ncbi:MAG: sugar ABC transporter permease [Bacteroidaceae bacterium]|nr:sugar ABC transporter permease [Bacteroidaceae bacterium]
MKQSKMTLQKKRSLVGLAFTSPWIIGFIFLFFIPLIKTVFYSFSSIDMGNYGFDLNWVGFKNYRVTFLEDPNNLRMIISSIGNVIVSVIVIVVFSMFLAIILNQNFFGRSAARVVFALPIIIASGVIIVLLKENVLQQNMGSTETATTIFQSNGVLDFLKEMGLTDKLVYFFEGLVNDIFDVVWRSGIQIILFLSALQSIPASSYEAAKIEGATAWESFWFVTFPMVSPFLLVNIIYTIIDTFTNSTNTVMQKIFSLVSGIEYEQAAAFSLVYFILVLMVVGLVYIIMNKQLEK